MATPMKATGIQTHHAARNQDGPFETRQLSGCAARVIYVLLIPPPILSSHLEILRCKIHTHMPRLRGLWVISSRVRNPGRYVQPWVLVAPREPGSPHGPAALAVLGLICVLSPASLKDPDPTNSAPSEQCRGSAEMLAEPPPCSSASQGHGGPGNRSPCLHGSFLLR